MKLINRHPPILRITYIECLLNLEIYPTFSTRHLVVCARGFSSMVSTGMQRKEESVSEENVYTPDTANATQG